MVTKTKKPASGGSGSSGSTNAKNAQLASTVKESAQQIWLAGLGAFSKAQEEGGKVFEALVKEGTSLQRKTQAAAEEKISEATNRMATMAADVTSKASGQWGKLEDIFEERVSRALKKLGVPTNKDIDALMARIDELNRNVSKMPARKAATKKSSSKPTAKRASRKS
jgi:poly(hydroxyalkanoate) granule-associated protein